MTDERVPGVSPGGDQPVPEGRHEASDVSVRGIVRFGIGLAVATVLVVVAMWELFRVLDRRQQKEDVRVSPMVAAALRRTPPEPHLEANPLEPRRRMQAREEAVLTTYGWVDRASGIARIPIARAMDIIAERGLPPSKPMAPVATPGQATRGTGREEVPAE